MLHVGNLAKIVAETLRAAGISQDAPLTIRSALMPFHGEHALVCFPP